SFSMCAPAAAQRCGRNRAIAACSAPTARRRVRRSRPSVWGRAAQLPAKRPSPLRSSRWAEGARMRKGEGVASNGSDSVRRRQVAFYVVVEQQAILQKLLGGALDQCRAIAGLRVAL